MAYNYLIIEDNILISKIKVVQRCKDLKTANALKGELTKQNKVFYKICVILEGDK